MVYYTWDNYQVSCVKIDSMTAWRNGDVKLATAECVELEPFIDLILTQPHENQTRTGKTGKFTLGRYGTSMTDGFLRATHKLCTAQFIYWIMQACTTTDNTPGAGYHTHVITVRATTTPLNLGYHIQSKGADNLLWDCLGLAPSALTIRCSENEQSATQTIEIPFAFLQSAGDDFSKTARAEGTTGTLVKNWNHFVTGGLGAGQTALSLNAGSTECDIIGIRIMFRNNTWLGTRDATGYSTAGLVKDFDWTIELDVIPTGDQLFTLARTTKAGLEAIGDLDLDFVINADNTNDKITFAFDKLIMMSFDKTMTYANHPEVYTITLEPKDENSSLTVTAIDSLVDDYYET